MGAALGLMTFGYLLVLGYAFYLAWWLGVATILLAVGFIAVTGRATGAIVGARIVTREQEPRIHAILERLCQLDDAPKPTLAIIESQEPNAFAAGSGRHATIFLTTALVSQLTDAELQAVVAHELAHIVNRDSLLMASAWVLPLIAGLVIALGLALAGAARGGGWVGLMIAFAGFFLAAFGVAALIACVLIALGLSRAREFAADRYAGRLTGDPRALSSALGRLSGAPSDTRLAPLAALLVRPPRRGAFSVVSTHPSFEARTRRLERLGADLETGPAETPARYLGRGASAASAAIIAAGPLSAALGGVVILLVALSGGG